MVENHREKIPKGKKCCHNSKITQNYPGTIAIVFCSLDYFIVRNFRGNKISRFRGFFAKS